MNARRHSMLYDLYIGSWLWQLRRWWWYSTSTRRCARCSTALDLHGPRAVTVHHLTYARLGRERRSDVQLLCWPCHRRADAWRWSR